ncbi:MAG: hypothetical protein KDE26_31365, partial [Bacteroidetes bacterium]|nr:hypothetical protein [Bacteroidota bacterium]
IIIPPGYQVRMVEGTEIDFVQGAKFLSYSPVFLEGGPETPIRITSSDHSANGFTILNTTEESRLNYATFEDFNTLNDRGWSLTGAVTFYESPVSIDNCAFIRSHCEDGLNIIRTTFSLRNSLVSESAFDGFDADFCQGEVINTRFIKPGNDGMDFSGSIVTVKDSEVDQAGDKGISIGEEATVNIWSLKVSNSNSGLVAKDLSKVTVTRIELHNCQTGFAAYQKKPEFGGGSIVVHDYQADQVKFLHLIEKGSSLKLRGTEINGI